MKKVLIIGSGGREHALSWKLAQSEKVERVFVTPGNGGTQGGKLESVNISIDKHDELLNFVKENNIDLVVVTPDDALALGLVDVFQKENIPAFGPTQKAAQIESSKALSKDLMIKYDIPTARFKTFTSYDEAKAYSLELLRDSLERGGESGGGEVGKVVVKASGLALGKGVYICETKEQVEESLGEIMLDKKFGDSGNEVVIEEFLKGVELSIHVFCDGKTSVLFPTSQDHKTIYEGNKGPNTGGMGTIAPLPWITNEHLEKINNEIVKPLLTGMEKEDVPFAGLLYPGLMENNGEFNVVEFNARFGDPETQSYMRLLETDLYDVLYACATGTLDQVEIKWNDKSVACIVLASEGYPNSYEKGFEITGIEKAESDENVVVFHAGTKQMESKTNSRFVTSGGRVLNVTAIGNDLEEALNKAYKAVEKIDFKGKYFRKDIGKYCNPRGCNNL